MVKINNKLLALGAVCLSLFTSSCGEKFLTHENLYEVNTDTYYTNAGQIFESLTGVYSRLTPPAAGNPLILANILSDDCFGGGDSGGDSWVRDMDNFQNIGDSRYEDLWRTSYEGIFRANTLINNYDRAEFDDETLKNQMLGEAHFLRGFFYFRIVKFFGQGPLRLGDDELKMPSVSADELYAQIAFDLKKAIELMSAEPYSTSMNGRATKWAAEGLMARVFLFYTGKYGQSSLPLLDGEISKEQVQGWINDCISNSGHKLNDDFRNNWPYSYANEEYGYASDNGLSWIDDANGNFEVLFAAKYSVHADWGSDEQNFSRAPKTNFAALFMGMRGQSTLPAPFGNTSWGWATVNPELWNSFEVNDIRQVGSIISVFDPIEGGSTSDYEYDVSGFQDTGFWNKKYCPISVMRPNEDGEIVKVNMFDHIYGEHGGEQLDDLQEYVILRYSDVLLMAAELDVNPSDNFNAVRRRAGLDPVEPTLENIKKERRHELAFEGIRYFDLLRWHDEETALNRADGTSVHSQGVEEIYKVKYRPETNGFLPIPESEIRITGGLIKQNPGWE